MTFILPTFSSSRILWSLFYVSVIALPSCWFWFAENQGLSKLHVFNFFQYFKLILNNLSGKIFVVAVRVCVTGESSIELTVEDPTVREELKVSRSDFPSDFVFGAGTSAPQVHEVS